MGCPRAPGSRCSRRSSAWPQGRVPSSCSAQLVTTGLHPRPGRRRDPPAHEPADARQAEEAQHRGGGRPAGGQGDRQAAPHRLGRDRARAGQRRGERSSSSTVPPTTPTGSAATPRSWPAPTSTTSHRGARAAAVLVQRARGGPARACSGLGTRMEVDPDLVVPDRGPRASPTTPSRRGTSVYVARATSSTIFRTLAERTASPSTPRGRRPARTARAADPARRQGHAAGASATATGTGAERTYNAKFEGALPVRPTAVRRGRDRQQPRALRRLHARGAVRPATGPGSSPPRWRSPSCGPQHRRGLGAVDRRAAMAFMRGLTLTEREAAIAERVVKEINERLRFLLDVGLDYLTLSRSGRQPVGRRGAADPAGHPDRLGAGGRPVRAGRAVDRPAPARQPPADRDARPAAGPGQHPHRRRTRRGHHPHRRLGRRHRPGRGGARRQGRRLGSVEDLLNHPESLHRRLPVRTPLHPGPGGAAPRQRAS
jgi:hypothetical protein